MFAEMFDVMQNCGIDMTVVGILDFDALYYWGYVDDIFWNGGSDYIDNIGGIWDEGVRIWHGIDGIWDDAL